MVRGWLLFALVLQGCGPSIQVVRMGRQLPAREPGCGARRLDIDPQQVGLTMETVGTVVIDAPVPLGPDEERAVSERACALGGEGYVPALSAGGRSTFFVVVPRESAGTPPAPPASRPSRRPIVAVVPLNDRAGLLAPGDRETLGLYLATRVAGTGRYRVVPPEDVRARLVADKRESYRECYDTRCQIELGRALAAQKTVAALLLRVGPRCSLSLNLYDLKTETSEAAASVEVPCSADGVRAGIERVTEKLGAER